MSSPQAWVHCKVNRAWLDVPSDGVAGVARTCAARQTGQQARQAPDQAGQAHQQNSTDRQGHKHNSTERQGRHTSTDRQGRGTSTSALHRQTGRLLLTEAAGELCPDLQLVEGLMVLQRLRISVDCPELDALFAERRDGQERGRKGRPEMGGISVGVQHRCKTRSGWQDQEQKQWWVGSVAAWTA